MRRCTGPVKPSVLSDSLLGPSSPDEPTSGLSNDSSGIDLDLLFTMWSFMLAVLLFTILRKSNRQNATAQTVENDQDCPDIPDTEIPQIPPYLALEDLPMLTKLTELLKTVVLWLTDFVSCSVGYLVQELIPNEYFDVNQGTVRDLKRIRLNRGEAGQTSRQESNLDMDQPDEISSPNRLRRKKLLAEKLLEGTVAMPARVSRVIPLPEGIIKVSQQWLADGAKLIKSANADVSVEDSTSETDLLGCDFEMVPAMTDTLEIVQKGDCAPVTEAI